MFEESSEPIVPEQSYSKRASSSIISFQTHHSKQNPFIDASTLVNNASSSTINAPALGRSTRVSSTIMTGSVTITKGQQHAMNKAHQVIDISTRVPTKSIRIERNYSLGDGITRFNTEYPIELTGRLSPEQFQYTIEEINKKMDYADRLSWRIVFENIIETLTIYIWPILFSTHYQRSVKQLLSFIDSENINVYHPQSLSISNPVKSAFLYIEINFFD